MLLYKYGKRRKNGKHEYCNGGRRALNRKAFTLAEVLITLAIIGVVAALTIPTVVRNYQKQQLKVQFKKAYSTVMQTVSKTYADLGYQAQCYAYRDSFGTAHFNYSECIDVFWPQFFKNLKVAKACDTNGFANGCVPAYLGPDGIYQKQQKAQAGDPDYDPDYGMKVIAGCPAWTSANFRDAPAYVLADGLIFSFAYTKSKMPIFAIDINGKKPPNKLGHDVFAFMFNAQNGLGRNIKLQEAYCFTPDEGGLTTTQMLKDAMTK